MFCAIGGTAVWFACFSTENYEEPGIITIKIGTVPKFDYILNEIVQPYAGFRTVLFTYIFLPVFLSLMVKICVLLVKYWERRDVNVMITSPFKKYLEVQWVSFVKSAFVQHISHFYYTVVNLKKTTRKLPNIVQKYL